MADEDHLKTEEELEEERLSKSLSMAKLRAHNAFGVTHVPKKASPAKPVSPSHQQGQPNVGFNTMQGRAPSTLKSPKSAGELPEWKKAQLEREEKERQRQEEEERRKKQYAEQIIHSAKEGHSVVDTTSPSAGTFVDPESRKVPEVRPDPSEEIAAAGSIFDDKDKEEELRKEEEYLMRRTGSAPSMPKKKHFVQKSGTSSIFTGDRSKDAHLGFRSDAQKIIVRWVDAQGELIDQGGFFARHGHLPLAAIEAGLHAKNPIWKETGQAIVAGPDGYSTISFGNREVIEITAEHK